MNKLLSVSNLCITDTRSHKTLVHNLSFELEEGETLGIIGESGSGKSLSCKAILGLLDPYLHVEGSIVFENEELVGCREERLRAIRGKKIALIVQNALGAFDPLSRIEVHMMESLGEHMRASLARECSEHWLAMMGLDAKRVMSAYAHELSGGMLQRVMIALALAQETKLIIADEPTSALDVIHQRMIIEHLKTIQKSFVCVSHDLGVIAYVADKTLVMKEGVGVEYQPTASLFDAPQHPYTRYLIESRAMLSKRFMQCFR